VQWAAAGQIPARNSVRNNSGQLQSIAAPIAAIAEEASYTVLQPGGVPGFYTAVGIQGFERTVDAVLLGREQNIKQALDNAAAKSDQILKQNQQRYQ
jgi:ABC-type glycerol-3-phosphate transport system substrate-binding protein